MPQTLKKHRQRATKAARRVLGLSRAPLSFVLVVGIVFALFAGGAAAITTNSTLRTAVVSRIGSIIGVEPTAKDKQDSSHERPPVSSSASNTGSNVKQKTNTAPTGIKYSISADPRSTAYSLTPYVNPASFEHRVTHAGQFAPGTLIAYNATKGDKTYYSGDLIISPSTVTIHIINGYASGSEAFTVSAPDGFAVGMPSTPWYMQDSAIASPAMSGDFGVTIPDTAKTWTLILSPNSATIPVGTYTVQIMTDHAGSGPNAWEYDGFITVNVVAE